MKARFVKKVKRNSTISSFYFQPEAKMDYIAGQFIELALPFKTKEVRGNKRWFTLSSSPGEEYLFITTRVFTERSLFKKKLASMRPGQEVDIALPMGDFVLPKSKEADLIFIAIGIGITPFRSIVNHLAEEGKERKITLIFANKNSEDFIFDNLFSKAKISYIKHHGKLELADIKSYVTEIKSKTIYLSGPERTVESFYKDLLSDGIRPEKISVDYFHNYD
ncbi:MAG TPA: FAD-dependent oxidoreductase [Candidatus Saccharimonadales bacterium]|nr:FAD-dependent oxidoreductase [Candidatus Saccharimonadales bacterium]